MALGAYSIPSAAAAPAPERWEQRTLMRAPAIGVSNVTPSATTERRFRSADLRALGFDLALPRLVRVAPTPVERFTASRRAGTLTMEWAATEDSTVVGVVVLGSVVPIRVEPFAGLPLRPLTRIGDALVLCVEPTSSTSCSVEIPSQAAALDGYEVYLAAFTYNADLTYSEGVEALGYPIDPSTARWSYSTVSDQLAPPAAAAGRYVVGTGDAGFLNRVTAEDGLRGDWSLPQVGALSFARPMAGDLGAEDAPDLTTYLSGRDGFLYRYGLDDDTTDPDAVRAVAGTGGDAGCTEGRLTAGPVVMLDAFDANTNDSDDVVLVATDCDGTENGVLIYSHDLANLFDRFGGGEAGLGASTAPPRILYRSAGNNLVYVPLLDTAADVSLVVMEIAEGPELSAYATLSGLGSVRATPIPFSRRENDALLLVGSENGMLYLFDAVERDGEAGSALVLIDSLDLGDGAVRGLAVSNPIPAGEGAFENQVAVTTESSVHGLKIGADRLFDTGSHWAHARAAAAEPIVLRNAFARGDTVAFFALDDGSLISLDARDGASLRTWEVAPGTPLTSPTFDYADGEEQGIIVGALGGGIFWIPLTPAEVTGGATTEETLRRRSLEISDLQSFH